jgi:hypothetical protein
MLYSYFTSTLFVDVKIDTRQLLRPFPSFSTRSRAFIDAACKSFAGCAAAAAVLFRCRAYTLPGTTVASTGFAAFHPLAPFGTQLFTLVVLILRLTDATAPLTSTGFTADDVRTPFAPFGRFAAWVRTARRVFARWPYAAAPYFRCRAYTLPGTSTTFTGFAAFHPLSPFEIRGLTLSTTNEHMICHHVQTRVTERRESG